MSVSLIIPTGILHEATGLSFNKTEQAPQYPLVHPHFTEGQERRLKTAMSESSGRESRIILSPFKVIGMFIFLPHSFLLCLFLLYLFRVPSSVHKADFLYMEFY